MDWQHLGGFLLASLILAVVPGPSAALVIRRSALSGVWPTLPVILGDELGMYLWAVASAVGLAALVAASQLAYLVLRVVGAAFLILLGVQAWRASRHLRAEASPAEPAPPPPGWRALGTGLVTNLANPKAAIFAFAFYPQFIPPHANVLTVTLFLALLQVLIDGTWSVVLAALVSRAAAFFRRTTVRRWLERATGTVLIALGIQQAAEHA